MQRHSFVNTRPLQQQQLRDDNNSRNINNRNNDVFAVAIPDDGVMVVPDLVAATTIRSRRRDEESDNGILSCNNDSNSVCCNTSSSNSSIELVPIAPLPRAGWVIELIRQQQQQQQQQSTVLSMIPQLRKDTICESCRLVKNEEELKEIFIEVMSGSPYFPLPEKQKLVELTMKNEWDKIVPLVLSSSDANTNTNINPTSSESSSQPSQQQIVFQPCSHVSKQILETEFKYTAIQIFLKSRKIRQLLSKERRKQLGTRLLKCCSTNNTTKEEIIEFLLTSLVESEIFSPCTRRKIANDVLDGKFYRLLLEDRFDCDDHPRLDTTSNNNNSNRNNKLPLFLSEYCVICFDTFQDDNWWMLKGCCHMFCRDCIQDWACHYSQHDDDDDNDEESYYNNNNNNQQSSLSFPCPICQKDSTLPLFEI